MEKSKLTITRERLIRDIAKDLDRKYRKDQITEILNNMEWWCNQYLTQATPTRDVQIRPFYGLQLNSSYKPDTIRNTVYGNDVFIPAHIEVKAKYTRYHNRIINQMAKGEA